MVSETWFKDAIIYHILIDRFSGYTQPHKANEPTFIGGTLQGITEQLPYLQKLGINTLWISPFTQTSAYHGYHITDFYSVDPHFGSQEDLQTLITKSHAKNIRIIADFVPNHCSNQHPYFQYAQHHSDSPYREWFTFQNYPHTYLRFLSIDDLPKLNLQHPKTRSHIIQAAHKWLSLGLDGFRLDHVIGAHQDFWRTFVSELKQRFPSAIFIGEAWMMGIRFRELKTINVPHKYLHWLHSNNSDGLLKEYQGILDGVLDFGVQESLKRYATSPHSSRTQLERHLKRHYHHFQEDFLLPTFLDNHDMDRAYYYCHHDKEQLKELASIQFSLPQPPIIYYGTEAGLTQTQSIWGAPQHGDLSARQPFPWDNIDEELFTFYQELIQKRKEKRN